MTFYNILDVFAFWVLLIIRVIIIDIYGYHILTLPPPQPGYCFLCVFLAVELVELLFVYPYLLRFSVDAILELLEK